LRPDSHELGHATGSAKRLNRQFGKRFGDDAYAFEEIVASLTQATLCAEYGLPNELHDSHASYIHHWMKILRGDKTAILHAAAKAEQAVKWLRQFDPAPGGRTQGGGLTAMVGAHSRCEREGEGVRTRRAMGREGDPLR
jgi:antirestriction protein ArdC